MFEEGEVARSLRDAGCTRGEFSDRRRDPKQP